MKFYSIEIVLKGRCDRWRDTGNPSGRKRKIAEFSSFSSVQFSYLFFKLTAYQHVYMYIITAISRNVYNNDRQCIIAILEQHAN